ncbi:hypothetical protein DL98DRAFT_513142 [Cadophora sp. DSE1049]|nr:hypothetical protein DL98DRAFT_513142 [Cadophora sp. DSE1049]
MERDGRVPHPNKNIVWGRVAYVHEPKPGPTLYGTYEGLRNYDQVPPAAAAAGPGGEDEDENEIVPAPEPRQPGAAQGAFSAPGPVRRRTPPTPEYHPARRRQPIHQYGYGDEDDQVAADADMRDPTPSPPKKVSRGRKIMRSVSNAINAARHRGDSRPSPVYRPAHRPSSAAGSSFANAPAPAEISIPVKPQPLGLFYLNPVLLDIARDAIGYAPDDPEAEKVGAVKLVGNMSHGAIDMEDFIEE